MHPRIVGEFDDSALPKAFGQGGAGLSWLRTAIARYVQRQYGVRAVGRIGAVVEELYEISTERRLRHPATIAIARRRSATSSAIPAPPDRCQRGSRPALGSSSGLL